MQYPVLLKDKIKMNLKNLFMVKLFEKSYKKQLELITYFT